MQSILLLLLTLMSVLLADARPRPEPQNAAAGTTNSSTNAAAAPASLLPPSAPGTQTVLTLVAGPITGLKVNSNLFKFLGIPYAQAPTGNNRFASPVAYPAAGLLAPFFPGGKFSNHHSITATAFGNICPQAAGGAEDCLSLNIFTTTVSPLALRPVMFWIHGGSFVQGSSADPSFDGTALAQQNTVVVTFNYRLGILGWIDGGSDFPTVNMGMQDAILALKWVQMNILFFGGDPTRITIFGESSGGQMIRALMASPKAKGLFKRAIIQSDPQNYPLETRDVSQGIVGAYALSQLGCTTVACARGLSVSQIVSATTVVSNNGPYLNPAVPITPLSPAIDGTWVQGDSTALIQSGSLPNQVDVIMGTVANEATPEVFQISPVPLPTAYFQYIMAIFVGPTRSAAICAQPQFQLNPSDPDTVRNTLSRVGTLFFWSCANQANALTYKNLANVYLYELDMGCTNPDNANDSMCVGEVCHEDDIGITFGTCTNPTSQQKALSNEIMARWAAFANNGNPNIPGKTTWNKVVSSTNLNQMLFSATDTVNQTMNAAFCGPIFGDLVPFNFELY